MNTLLIEDHADAAQFIADGLAGENHPRAAARRVSIARIGSSTLGRKVTRIMPLENGRPMHFDLSTTVIETQPSPLRSQIDRGDGLSRICPVRAVGCMLNA